MLVAMTGATGYVGGYVARQLLRRGHTVRALVRTPARAGRLADSGIEVVAGDVTVPATLGAWSAGTDAIVHLVGIIVESGGATFRRVHLEGTRNVLGTAAAARVPLVVHMSALGARSEPAATGYHRTKAAAEEAVRGSGLPHAILRPSLIAGPENAALKTMVDMIRLAPLVPVIGDGRYRMQPVWAGDVAEAFALVLESTDLRGTFEIAGPEALTYHQVLDHLEAALGVRRPRFAVPVGVARFAAQVADLVPQLAPITPEQLQMLLEENVASDNALPTRFGVEPRPFAEVAREIAEAVGGSARAAR